MSNRPETVPQSLRCPLNEQEKVSFGESLARFLEDLEDLEEQKVATAATIKAQIEGTQKAITKARKILSAGYEYRWITCKVLYNAPSNRQKTILRLDTGEEVRVEDMTDDECQENLPLTIADAIEQRLPEINAELQANAPPGTQVTLSMGESRTTDAEELQPAGD